MDAMISQLEDWAYRLAVLQRSCGSRLRETLLLQWTDLDLDARRLTFRPETTKGGYGGRVLPIPRHLAAELAGWPTRAAGGSVVSPPAAELGARGHAGRSISRAWARAGIRREAWWSHPTHALRKGWVSGLLALGADRDAVEVLAGHSLGRVRDSYVDPAVALSLRATMDLVPEPGRMILLEQAVER
jgi:integrase